MASPPCARSRLLEVYIDADACPVKDEVYRVAERYGLKVWVVANGWLRVPDSPLVERVTVTEGLDVADDWIVEHAGAGDIVVTADIPLADRCVKRGARVLAPTGPAVHAGVDRQRPRHPQPADRVARHRPDPRRRPAVRQAGPLAFPGSARQPGPGVRRAPAADARPRIARARAATRLSGGAGGTPMPPSARARVLGPVRPGPAVRRRRSGRRPCRPAPDESARPRPAPVTGPR